MLVPAGTWRMARGLPSVMLARALFIGAFYACITYVPLFLVGQRGLSLQVAGLALAVGAIGWAAGAWYQGHDHLTCRATGSSRSAACSSRAASAGLSAVAWFGLAWWIVPIALVVAGVAMGLGVTTMTVLALELSPVEEHGAASSSLQLADVLGSVLGIAAATAVFAAWHDPGHDDALFGRSSSASRWWPRWRCPPVSTSAADRPRAQRPGGALLRRSSTSMTTSHTAPATTVTTHRPDDGSDGWSTRAEVGSCEPWPWWPCGPAAATSSTTGAGAGSSARVTPAPVVERGARVTADGGTPSPGRCRPEPPRPGRR